jgi:hypothetical protein
MAARMRLCLINLLIFILLFVLLFVILLLSDCRAVTWLLSLSKHCGSRLFVFPPDCAALVEGYYSIVPSGRGLSPEKRTDKSREKFGCQGQEDIFFAERLAEWEKGCLDVME